MLFPMNSINGASGRSSATIPSPVTLSIKKGPLVASVAL
jgi:hypothetical protein